METVLPKGASFIEAKDLDTLRFAVRTDGEKGFLFINNFQDHETAKPKQNETVTIQTKDGEIVFDHLDLAGEENCILPFYMDMDGILLEKATAQPITRLERGGDITYVFLKPEGMKAAFYFEEGVQICGGNPGADGVLRCEEDRGSGTVPDCQRRQSLKYPLPKPGYGKSDVSSERPDPAVCPWGHYGNRRWNPP
ncbi:hypothetical protein LC724_30225 [Blautia sp. RD014234]|nr:hypothetical protein [Blautia parvula]